MSSKKTATATAKMTEPVPVTALAKSKKAKIINEVSSGTDIDKALAQTYQMKTDKQHVLDNPDT